jgi:hypothetical protein
MSNNHRLDGCGASDRLEDSGTKDLLGHHCTVEAKMEIPGYAALVDAVTKGK